MKMFAMIAAGLLGLAATAPTAAVAAPVTTTTAEPVQDRVIVRERTVVRRDDRGYRGNRWGSRRVCRNEWRHHRKVRICRTVRYRR